MEGEVKPSSPSYHCNYEFAFNVSSYEESTYHLVFKHYTKRKEKKYLSK